MSQTLPRSVLLATYFEMYMMKKMDAGKIKQMGEDISKNIENDISTTLFTAKESADSRKLKEAELKKNLDSYNRRMEKLLMKIEEENIRTLKGGKPSIVAWIKPFLAIFVAEFLGTLILVLVGCACVIEFKEDPPFAHHITSLGFGFAVHLSIQIVGHVSSCHINPTVSIVALLLGCINYIQFPIYISAQFLGAFTGFGLLKLLFPASYIKSGFCMTKVSEEVTITQGFFIEFLITCLLCFAVCAIWDPQNASKNDSIPIRFALVIGVLAVIAGPLTGASMNTARSFGPAVLADISAWDDQWVYWIAPNLSPFVSVGIYKFFFSAPATKISKKQAEEDVGASA
ncbi:hypothetical protein HHI36_011106 [Cryptolaemus montrouzieri]|uniref:Aquaporin n=1 Tax=Cryptolaemus montrouzieri TaxID=559131 RepID=A0ABD2MKT9_9CUCU